MASIAIALMTFYLQKNKHAAFTLDTIALAALVHEIDFMLWEGFISVANDIKEMFT